jgi:hypothetical protein
MPTASEAALTISCPHGNRPGAVVCVHLLTVKDHVAGFIENSSDPANLQAWCDACERFFLREGDRTSDFIKFADIAIVCDLCYLEAKARHCRLTSE